MPRKFRRAIAAVIAWALVAALASVAAPASAQTPAHRADSTQAPATLAGARLATALRNGGYILYFRHTATDFGQNDERMTGYEDCATQRNLTDAGRADATAIGAAIRALGIPIGAVLASPYCRTMETAQLMFGRATASTAVRGGPAQASAERYAELTKLLSTKPAPGANLVISGHGNPYRAVVGGAYLQEGEAAIVEPLGADGFRVVARIRKDEWAALGNP